MGNWWAKMGIFEQVFWTAAIVITILSMIHFILHLFSHEHEKDGKTHPLFRTRHMLAFLTFFSWGTILGYHYITGILSALLLGMGVGIVMTLIMQLFINLIFRKENDLHAHGPKVLFSIGEVLQPIPPHKIGRGKVHINLRGMPYEVEAITEGNSLPEGAPIRVVEVVDERIFLVEPIHLREEQHPE